MGRDEVTREEAQRIWELCLECSEVCYDTKPPNSAYAHRAARLLLGTAMQESNLMHRRQLGVMYWSACGGASLWQLEQGSIVDSLGWLRGRPDAAKRVTQFLFSDPRATPDWIIKWPVWFMMEIMRLTHNDRLGVMFARLHYLRDKHPIPDRPEEQARYWKQVYNTPAGSGTISQYLANWERVEALVWGAPE